MSTKQINTGNKVSKKVNSTKPKNEKSIVPNTVPTTVPTTGDNSSNTNSITPITLPSVTVTLDPLSVSVTDPLLPSPLTITPSTTSKTDEPKDAKDSKPKTEKPTAQGHFFSLFPPSIFIHKFA